MKSVFLTVVIVLLTHSTSRADSIFLRYGNVVATGSGLFDLQPYVGGKLLQVAYARPLSKNIFFEGAVGEFSPADFLDKGPTVVLEASLGGQVSAGPVRAYLSQGVSRFYWLNWVTHLGVCFVDHDTGFSIGLERSHYSTGHESGQYRLSDDFTGIRVGYDF